MMLLNMQISPPPVIHPTQVHILSSAPCSQISSICVLPSHNTRDKVTHYTKQDIKLFCFCQPLRSFIKVPIHIQTARRSLPLRQLTAEQSRWGGTIDQIMVVVQGSPCEPTPLILNVGQRIDKGCTPG
jgi:hypothetical protein